MVQITTRCSLPLSALQLGGAAARRPTCSQRLMIAGEQPKRLIAPSRGAAGMQRSAIVLASSLAGELVTDEAQVRAAMDSAPVVLIDWMASWCRKCKYLKPKLDAFMEEEFPGVPLLMVDVNALPGDLVRGAGIKQMPTLQLWRGGSKTAELVAGSPPAEVIEQLRALLKEHVT